MIDDQMIRDGFAVIGLLAVLFAIGRVLLWRSRSK